MVASIEYFGWLCVVKFPLVVFSQWLHLLNILVGCV
jgi:hypothetical protein